MSTIRIAFVLVLLSSQHAQAETVCVKYGPCKLDLSTFECSDVTSSSFVRRIYDELNGLMAIKLMDTWYPHCEVDALSARSLRSAPSIGGYYNQHFRSKPNGTRGPFDCRDHPMPIYDR
jgi:hypothetical protein